eukprot:SAG22_NODE_8193_length_676_cov_0.571924_2_plen_100_part_01
MNVAVAVTATTNEAAADQTAVLAAAEGQPQLAASLTTSFTVPRAKEAGLVTVMAKLKALAGVEVRLRCVALCCAVLSATWLGTNMTCHTATWDTSMPALP